MAHFPLSLHQVGQYLEDKPLSQEIFPAPTEWQRMIGQNECIRKSALIYKHDERASLVQQFKGLQSRVSVIFEQQQKVISESFQLAALISHKKLDSPSTQVSVRSYNVLSSAGEPLNYFIYHVSGKCFWFVMDGAGNQCRQFQFEHVPFYYNGFDGAEFEFLDFQFYNDDTVSMLLRCSMVGGERRVYFLQLPIASLITSRFNFYEVMDPNCLKLVEGTEWRYLAVSGNRKVCSLLSENRKRVCVFETEVEDDEDEEMDNSNNLDESK